MPRIRRRNGYEHVSVCNSGSIMAYRECGLSFCDTATRIGRNPENVMLIWNQWVQESHTKRHTGSERSRTTNAWEDRHFVRSDLQDRIAISRTLCQEIDLFATSLFHELFPAIGLTVARQISGRAVRR